MNLWLDPKELEACVQCGLCLPHCPTYRVSGDESQSPRGRIALMRAVQDDNAPLTADIVRSFESCVQCRGCEAACPSQVSFGHLMERTRESLAANGTITPKWQRAGFKLLAHPHLLRIGSLALAVAQRLHVVPSRLGVPAKLPIWRKKFTSSGDEVWLFTGCVMDAWQRDVHQDGQQVLEAAGFAVRPTGTQAPCCGALQDHAGLTNETRRLAERMIRNLAGNAPVLVDSAGCGAAMKEYGHLLGTPEAREFSARVFDIQEWLALRMDRLPKVEPLNMRVAIQDPCHQRHVQRSHEGTRTVLRPYVRELVELDDQGLCCGAGGAYSVFEPEMANQIRARKVSAIERAAPDVVASANPGCSLHLAAAGVPTVHPMTLIKSALAGSTSAIPR